MFEKFLFWILAAVERRKKDRNNAGHTHFNVNLSLVTPWAHYLALSVHCFVVFSCVTGDHTPLQWGASPVTKAPYAKQSYHLLLQISFNCFTL